MSGLVVVVCVYGAREEKQPRFPPSVTTNVFLLNGGTDVYRFVSNQVVVFVQGSSVFCILATWVFSGR